MVVATRANQNRAKARWRNGDAAEAFTVRETSLESQSGCIQRGAQAARLRLIVFAGALAASGTGALACAFAVGLAGGLAGGLAAALTGALADLPPPFFAFAAISSSACSRVSEST